jgi:hypothetical protein
MDGQTMENSEELVAASNNQKVVSISKQAGSGRIAGGVVFGIAVGISFTVTSTRIINHLLCYPIQCYLSYAGWLLSTTAPRISIRAEFGAIAAMDRTKSPEKIRRPSDK